MRARRKWRSGARGCWWAIVPVKHGTVHPLPWNMAATRKGAWFKWSIDRGSALTTYSKSWKAVRVFIVESQP